MWIIIPIMALSIPLVAIIAGGPIGKAIGESIKERHSPANSAHSSAIRDLETRINNLEETIGSLNTDIKYLEEKNSFFSRLLEDDDKASRS